MRSVDSVSLDARRWPAPEVGELLVLWQHPGTREIVPIGRLAYDGERYAFDYTVAATRVQDFRPLPGLTDIYSRYEQAELPLVLASRVMASDRPDYGDYLRSIGLDEDQATPWEQIVHSGGERAGDTLQFMQMPAVVSGHAQARFLVNGVRHIPSVTRSVGGTMRLVTPSQHESAMRHLRPGDAVRIEAEDRNARDPHACLVTSSGVPLGWVPRAMSAGMRALLRYGAVTPTVVRVGSPAAPAHLRLVVDVNQPAPPGFDFDADGRWAPASTRGD